MRWDVVGLVLGWTIRLVSFPMLLVAIYSGYYEGIQYSIRTFLIPLLISLILGQYLISLSKGLDASDRVRDREAFASVALGWIPVVIVGSMPYWLGGMFHGPFEYLDGNSSLQEILTGILHSWFESMSGFTTTGATVIDQISSPICQLNPGEDCIASQKRSLILWRSITQWLGGMGVIMLGLLILSKALGGGMALARAELTGPSLTNLSTSLEGTARRLWSIYVALTFIEMLLLYFVGGMDIFDSLNYSLTTLSSGGFGTSDNGIMNFKSAKIELIIMAFMLITCVNYSLLHLSLAGRSTEAFRDEELRGYLIILLIAFLAITINLYVVGIGSSDILETMRHSAFQAISISSTGYSSSNFADWPVFSRFVLLLLMIVGASGGSTGGGLKVIRIRIAYEIAKREVLKIIQPRKVVAIRFNKKVVEEERIWLILGMISSWLVLVTFSLLIFSLLEPTLDVESILSIGISLLGNTGPALGELGPTATWASLSSPSLLISTFLMWLGRLEILTVLVLLHPRTWESDQKN